MNDSRFMRKTAGFSLLEVLIALTILLISLGALLGMFTVAVGDNANQGEAATRTTEYAQDKMEQLLALKFADGTTNTRIYPPASLGGTGLGGNMAANSTVGSIDPANPVITYTDYLTAAGGLQISANGAFYERQWSITTDSTATLKTITVFVRALKPLGPGTAPTTTLVCYKSKTT
jgi:prepilin-type N-terminal cleavage/methylation domain-containing protein